MAELRGRPLTWGAARLVAVALLFGAVLLPSLTPLGNRAQVDVIVDAAAGMPASTAMQRVRAAAGERADIALYDAIVDTDDAIRNVLWNMEPGQPSALVIVSAGHLDPATGTTLGHASAAGIPALWLAPPADNVPAVRQVVAPAVARPGQRIGVAVETAGIETAELVLLGNGGEIAAVTIDDGGWTGFDIAAPAGGPLLLSAELRATDGALLARRTDAALVDVGGTPSIAVASNGPSLLADSLRRGGWTVTEFGPRELAGSLPALGAHAALVLDDIAVNDLPAGAWSSIVDAVTRDALGLLVLGGPNSFGLGGYRGSTLESLLPVVSEPPADEAPASLVFLVDVSGSMDRPLASGRRLQVARQAVLESAAALRPEDRVGLVTFDVGAELRLAPAARDQHAAAIAAAWPDNAGGGTRLAPALAMAVDALADEDTDQRLLVLLTDGFIDDGDLAEMQGLMAGTGIEFVALVIDDGSGDTDNPMARDLAIANSRIVRVTDVLSLPSLMRSEVELRRPAVVTGQSPVDAVDTETALAAVGPWPPVDAYVLTRPRDGATVHLRSARGDVILASHGAGVGTVIALTSGVSGWTPAWLSWPGWPAAAAAIANRVAVRANSESGIAVRTAGDGSLAIDLESAGLLPVELLLAGPTGVPRSLVAEPVSPGRLGAAFRPAMTGRHALSANLDGTAARRRFLYRPGGGGERPVAERFVDDGLLTRWQPDALASLAPPAAWQQLLAGLALIVFVLLLAAERLDGEVLRQALQRFRVTPPDRPS